MQEKQEEENVRVRSSDELMADPEWQAEQAKRQEKYDKEMIEETRSRLIIRRQEVKWAALSRKYKEKREAQYRKEIFDKMYNTPFTDWFIRNRLGVDPNEKDMPTEPKEGD